MKNERKRALFCGKGSGRNRISIALVYIPQEKDLQFSIMFGSYMVAIGWTF